VDAPKLIVGIRLDPMQNRRAIVEPGRTLRVGRTDRADFIIAQDAAMSALHFELTWDGAMCHLRNLDTGTGTLLGGQRVEEGNVPHGAWLRAGTTDLSVHIEAHTPPRGEDDTDDDEPALAALAARKKLAATAASMLEAEAGRAPLYAVLDAARDNRIVELLRESVEEHCSLYQGVKGEALADVAPYLVRLPAGSRLLQSLVEEGWGARWAIYLTSRRPFKDVRTHLRRFLMVENEETGEPLYFRFYDPGVLRRFLPVCSPRQAVELFADIEAFLFEGEAGELGRGAAPATKEGR
jgi:hypothetical protein